jgi:phenylalanyl-tRNA synthetase alpha chain
MNLTEKITKLTEEFFAQLEKIESHAQLEKLRIHYLSRQGLLSQLMAQLKDLSVEEKRSLGPLMNATKNSWQTAFERKEHELSALEAMKKQQKYKYFDVTAYKPLTLKGTLHPLTQLQQEIQDIFISMGFQIVDGPEVETDYYNFEALNIPEDHPARDMWDTFWLDIPHYLLRTHTSNVQIHHMEHQQPPLAMASLGRCYRHEATDASHDFVFMQAEALLIDKKISLSHLLATVKHFMRQLFAKKELDIRVRPSFFPFVEPGIEIDVACPFCNQGCSVCKYTRWIEMGGAGLVHPNVLQSCKIDSSVYSGFAWGFGLTRLAMLKYAIPDIRLLHSGSIEFLKQF